MMKKTSVLLPLLFTVLLLLSANADAKMCNDKTYYRPRCDPVRCAADCKLARGKGATAVCDALRGPVCSCFYRCR
ncbi:hypothetical protein H6P81_011405 [Aristolochia fimbriata]|uniref:Uncharacterized protein n=1 Tax=Aristolochia fimbriata TaxID=158543 RepID=A0AAV7ERF5_ARIFI|nr:hypothetical protein H6P81_011405 [Aristolochia fimbriata]